MDATYDILGAGPAPDPPAKWATAALPFLATGTLPGPRMRREQVPTLAPLGVAGEQGLRRRSASAGSRR